MSRPYGMELRERVVAAYKAGDLTIEEVAERFTVGTATVKRWARRERETGAPAPAPPGGGMPARVGAEHEPTLLRLIEENNDATVAELAVLFTRETGRSASRSSVMRAIHRLGLTRKKSP